jgi:hypothetical protein
VKFLAGVAEDGEGSAALPLTRRSPDRLMSRRMANLLTVAVVTGVVATIAAKMVFPSTPEAMASPVGDHPEVLGPTMTPSPLQTASAPDLGVSTGARRDYAVGLHDLRGLPLDTAPGTSLELWVAWDDAYAEGPQIQKLVKSVTLVRFIEAVTPEGPVVVVLSVPEKSMRAVMYGDVYGSFSVALPTG